MLLLMDSDTTGMGGSAEVIGRFVHATTKKSYRTRRLTPTIQRLAIERNILLPQLDETAVSCIVSIGFGVRLSIKT
jgi:hypothetical protein